MMKSVLLALVLFTISGQNVFAHGENKLGPHGGYIRMPGAFHVEIVPSHKDAFSVYLMDVNNTNPVTRNSDISLTHLSESGKKTDFSCYPNEDHFICKNGEKINSKEGKLLVKANRNNAKGNLAEYLLPLKLIGEAPKSSHEGHKMSH